MLDPIQLNKLTFNHSVLVTGITEEFGWSMLEASHTWDLKDKYAVKGNKINSSSRRREFQPLQPESCPKEKKHVQKRCSILHNLIGLTISHNEINWLSNYISADVSSHPTEIFPGIIQKTRSACKRDNPRHYSSIHCMQDWNCFIYLFFCVKIMQCYGFQRGEKRLLKRELPSIHLQAIRHHLQEMLERLELALGLPVDRCW